MGYALIKRTLIATFESSNAALMAAHELTGIGLPRQDLSIAPEDGAVLRAVVSSEASDSAVEILNWHGARKIETRSEGAAALPGLAISLS